MLLAGLFAQLAVALGMLGSAVLSGDRVGSLGGWYLVVVALIGSVVAVVPFVLMRYTHRRRLAAVLSVLIGLGFLVVTEFAPITWVFPLFLFAAAVRSWRQRPADATPGGT